MYWALKNHHVFTKHGKWSSVPVLLTCLNICSAYSSFSIIWVVYGVNTVCSLSVVLGGLSSHSRWQQISSETISGWRHPPRRCDLARVWPRKCFSCTHHHHQGHQDDKESLSLAGQGTSFLKRGVTTSCPRWLNTGPHPHASGSIRSWLGVGTKRGHHAYFRFRLVVFFAHQERSVVMHQEILTSAHDLWLLTSWRVCS